jgi:hypothetical protein
MTKWRAALAPALAALSAACGGIGAVPGAHPGGDPLSLTLEDADIERVFVDGRDGRLDVRVGGAGAVRARVALDGCGRGYRLGQRARGPRLELRVEPTTKDLCDELWVVELPPGVAVAGSFDRADVTIEGTSGGVDVRVGKGTIRLDVPRGEIRARVDNGDVIAHTWTRSYGDVGVEAEVGRVEVRVDGGLIRHERPHGSGDRLRIDSSGRDRISLSSIVGNVSLAIR